MFSVVIGREHWPDMGYILHWKTKIYILTKWHNLVETKFVIVLSQYETSSDEQNWTNFELQMCFRCRWFDYDYNCPELGKI